MSSDSKIELTGDTHQFVSGCEDISPGCAEWPAGLRVREMPEVSNG